LLTNVTLMYGGIQGVHQRI